MPCLPFVDMIKLDWGKNGMMMITSSRMCHQFKCQLEVPFSEALLGILKNRPLLLLMRNAQCQCQCQCVWGGWDGVKLNIFCTFDEQNVKMTQKILIYKMRKWRIQVALRFCRRQIHESTVKKNAKTVLNLGYNIIDHKWRN